VSCGHAPCCYVLSGDRRLTPPVGSPTIAILVMRQNRVLNILAAIAWLCYGCVVMFENRAAAIAIGIARNPIQCRTEPGSACR